VPQNRHEGWNPEPCGRTDGQVSLRRELVPAHLILELNMPGVLGGTR
jgi:hypothetical protein